MRRRRRRRRRAAYVHNISDDRRHLQQPTSTHPTHTDRRRNASPLVQDTSLSPDRARGSPLA